MLAEYWGVPVVGSNSWNCIVARIAPLCPFHLTVQGFPNSYSSSTICNCFSSPTPGDQWQSGSVPVTHVGEYPTSPQATRAVLVWLLALTDAVSAKNPNRYHRSPVMISPLF